jgi:hypothetical protein
MRREYLSREENSGEERRTETLLQSSLVNIVNSCKKHSDLIEKNISLHMNLYVCSL